LSTETIGRVAVVGAASQIGRALLPCLEAAGIETVRIGRQAMPGEQAPVHVFDEAGCTFAPSLSRVDAVISLAPLPAIGTVLDMAENLDARRVIAFGSTGRFSKVGSTSAIERDFVAQQTQAERLFATRSEKAGIAWTLFRPTMIYGAELDLNVAFIRSVIRRFGFFPLLSGALGRRQPVHVNDLADACVAALASPHTLNRAYDLGGGEVLAFPELVRRIFQAERKRPLMLPVPRFVYALIVAMARRLPRYRFIRQEMVDRMCDDLVADNRDAARDFGYRPRCFDPDTFVRDDN
jgi:nucleoside-diphosphate-sugar epimerase